MRQPTSLDPQATNGAAAAEHAGQPSEVRESYVSGAGLIQPLVGQARSVPKRECLGAPGQTAA